MESRPCGLVVTDAVADIYDGYQRLWCEMHNIVWQCRERNGSFAYIANIESERLDDGRIHLMGVFSAHRGRKTK